MEILKENFAISIQDGAGIDEKIVGNLCFVRDYYDPRVILYHLSPHKAADWLKYGGGIELVFTEPSRFKVRFGELERPCHIALRNALHKFIS